MNVENKLIPILREGVDVIKMIFFRKLRDYLEGAYPDKEPVYVNRLAGAIVNDLFGSAPPEEKFAAFAEENAFFIEKELQNLALNLKDMCIPLTDALRIQFLCDHQEGVDSTGILTRARDRGILIVDREVPLPARFIGMARRLGSAFNLLQAT